MLKALLWFVIVSIPFSQERIVVSGIPVYIHEILISISAAVLILGIFLRKRMRVPVPTAFLFASLLLFVGVVSSAAFGGFSREEAGAIKSWFVFPMIFWYVFYQAFEEKDIETLHLLWFSVFSGVAIAALIMGFQTFDGRLSFPVGSPNYLAIILEYGVVLGFSLIRFGTKNVRILASVFIIFLCGALMKTESLGAIIAASIGSVAVFLLPIIKCPPSRKMLLGVFIVFSLLVSISFRCIDWGLLGAGEIRTPLASRVMIWNTAFVMISEHPFFGVGPRNFEREYLALQPLFPPYLEWAVPHPHNIFLSFWLSSGILGFAGVVTLLFFVVKESFFRWFQKKDPVAITTIGLLFAFIIHGIVDTPYFRNDSVLSFWIIVGISLISMKPPIRS